MKKHWMKILISIVFLTFIILFLGYHLREHRLNSGIIAFPVNEQVTVSQDSADCKHDIYTILSIDGGGAHGLIPLYLLSKIEQSTNIPIRTSFDLIAGVSVGALLAAKLSLPNHEGLSTLISPDSLNAFTGMLAKIFYVSPSRKLLSIHGVLSPLYSARVKYEYLKTLYPENYTMKNLLGKTIIIGYDFKNDQILIFSNCAHCSPTHNNYTLLNILSGSSSPLGFFRPQILYNGQRKIEYILSDASYSLNDPTLISYWYGKKICPSSKVKYYFVLSLGTGQYPVTNGEKKYKLYFGIWHWLPDIFMGMLQSGHSEVQQLMQITKDRKLIYIRINPSLTGNETYPLNTAPEMLKRYLNIASDIYTQNTELFQCITDILKNQTVTKHCQDVLIQYEKSPKQNQQIFTNLPGFFEQRDSAHLGVPSSQ